MSWLTLPMDPEKVLSLIKTDLLAITTPRGQRSVYDLVQQVHLLKNSEFNFTMMIRLIHFLRSGLNWGLWWALSGPPGWSGRSSRFSSFCVHDLNRSWVQWDESTALIFYQIRDTHFYAPNKFLKYLSFSRFVKSTWSSKMVYLKKMVSFRLDFFGSFYASKNVLGFVRL